MQLDHTSTVIIHSSIGFVRAADRSPTHTAGGQCSPLLQPCHTAVERFRPGVAGLRQCIRCPRRERSGEARHAVQPRGFATIGSRSCLVLWSPACSLPRKFPRRVSADLTACDGPKQAMAAYRTAMRLFPGSHLPGTSLLPHGPRSSAHSRGGLECGLGRFRNAFRCEWLRHSRLCCEPVEKRRA